MTQCFFSMHNIKTKERCNTRVSSRRQTLLTFWIIAHMRLSINQRKGVIFLSLSWAISRYVPFFSWHCGWNFLILFKKYDVFFPSKKLMYSLTLKKVISSLTCIYGPLRWPFFLPFGYGRVLELFRMTNIWNGNNLEGMTIFGRNDTNLEGMTIIWMEWQ